MIIEKFENLQELIREALEEGKVKYIDVELELIDDMSKINNFIENNEIFYYVNKLNNMINDLERKFYDALV